MQKFLVILCILPLFAFAGPVLSDNPNTKAKAKIFKTGSRLRLQLGGQIGMNLDYFVYSNKAHHDMSIGYQGGVFFRVSRQKAFAQLELNLMYSSIYLKNGVFKRSEIKNNIPLDNLKLKYFTVTMPFIFGAYAVKKPVYKLRFYTGIELEFITNVKAIIPQNNNEVYYLKRSEKRDIFRTAQFSYQLGMGMDIAMFIFDVKYNVGMRNLIRENFRTQTHLLQFTVGAIF